MKPFYSYDFENGIEYHDTEADAMDRACQALEESREMVKDEGYDWDGNEDKISYGKVAGSAVGIDGDDFEIRRRDG